MRRHHSLRPKQASALAAPTWSKPEISPTGSDAEPNLIPEDAVPMASIAVQGPRSAARTASDRFLKQGFQPLPRAAPPGAVGTAPFDPLPIGLPSVPQPICWRSKGRDETSAQR